MSERESIGQVFRVALAVCVVCSVVVSGAAVSLRAAQEKNRAIDRQRNMLAAAGLLPARASRDEVVAAAARVEPRLVDLNTGRFAAPGPGVPDAEKYEALQATRDPALSQPLDAKEDIAGIRRRESYALVYLVEEEGQLKRIILPVRGYGLWSTLHGFLALEGDGNTVAGLGFYAHGETPGLGGEVDNPRWKALWRGKKLYSPSGYGREVALAVTKGPASVSGPDARHQVDGLSGATLTSRGVSRLLEYWLGSEGFGPFLVNLLSGRA